MMKIALTIPKATALLCIRGCVRVQKEEASVQISPAENGDQVQANASLQLEAPDQGNRQSREGDVGEDVAC
jgi:hypothetical protein